MPTASATTSRLPLGWRRTITPAITASAPPSTPHAREPAGRPNAPTIRNTPPINSSMPTSSAITVSVGPG